MVKSCNNNQVDKNLEFSNKVATMTCEINLAVKNVEILKGENIGATLRCNLSYKLFSRIRNSKTNATNPSAVKPNKSPLKRPI